MNGRYSIGFGSCLTYQDTDAPPDRGSKWSYQCPYCSVSTHSEVLNLFVTRGTQWFSLPSPATKLYTLILQCTRCEGVAMVLWPYGEDMRGHARITTRSLLPFPQAARQVFGSDDQSVPPAILEDLRQAELAFQAGAVNGAGLLLRRACQYICRDRGCKGRNLDDEIDALAPKYITKEMAELAHGIRIVGNEIAHPDPNTPARISAQDVSDCWDFTVELIKVIYIHPGQVADLRGRLGGKPSGEKTA